MALPGTRKTQIFEYLNNRVSYAVNNPRVVITKRKMHLNRLLKRRPSSYPFISGDTFRSMADHIWEEGNQAARVSMIQSGDVVFCQSEKVHQFREEILDKISVPIVLLLGNSDQNHSRDISELFNGGNLCTIFAQNLIESAPGVEPLPIGLENAWRANHG